MSGGILIKGIKLILLVVTLGMLVAMGAAQDGGQPYGQSHDGGYRYGGEQYDGQPYDGGQRHDGSHDNDFGGHHDWLNPGGVTHYYNSWWNSYPKYYTTYNYPNYYYNNYWYDPFPTYYYDYYWTYTYPTVYYSKYWPAYKYNSYWYW
jgi:hypothetical protein